MRTFKVGFSRPKRFKLVSFIIQKFMKTKFSHTYLVFDVQSTGQKVMYHATRKGVHCLEYETFKKDNIIITEIDVPLENRTESLRFCINHLGKAYSFITLLAILLNIRFGDGEKSFICSELVARSLNLEVKNLDTVTPLEIKNLLK